MGTREVHAEQHAIEDDLVAADEEVANTTVRSEHEPVDGSGMSTRSSIGQTARSAVAPTSRRPRSGRPRHLAPPEVASASASARERRPLRIERRRAE